MSLTDRCGNPTTFTPSTSAAEEVGMEPLEKKRREARAWVLRAASWKEFMVVTCCLYLGSYVVLEVEQSLQHTTEGFFDGQNSDLYYFQRRDPTGVSNSWLTEGEKYSTGTFCSLPISSSLEIFVFGKPRVFYRFHFHL